MKTKILALASTFAALTAVGAILPAIPLSPVPITLQTLFTYMAGSILGAKAGGLSQAIYVGIGTAGVPVFSGGGGGPSFLLGPRGGYLIGFILGAYTVGLVSRLKSNPGFRWQVLAMVAGTAVIYALGVLHLSFWISWNTGKIFAESFYTAVQVGMLPFLPGDSMKIVAASYIASRRQIKEFSRSLL